MRFLGLDIVGKNAPARRAAGIFDETYWEGQEADSTTVSGARVTPLIAMQVGAVNAAVRLIAETIASLPLILYRRDKSGNKERAKDHPLYHVLHMWPNEWMTRFEWIELMVRHLLLRGNAYASLQYQSGRIVGLMPLHPDNMTVKWIMSGKSKNLIYEYNADGKRTIFRDYDMIHLRGPSEDGGKGKGPIQEAREVVGNAVALDNYQSCFYANGVRLSGVLEHPGTLTDTTSERIATSFRKAYAGAANSGKVAVLEEGMKLNTTTMTPKDAEFIAVRKFSVREIARIFRVPPHMIGDLEDATFSNIEQESINFVVHSIRPWTVRIEQSLMKTLLTEEESEEYYAEFLLDGLLRGDMASRYTAYQIGLQNGFLKLNDVREKENMNSLEWGDMSMIPLNMRPVRSAADLDQVEVPPVVEEETPKEEDPSEDDPEQEDEKTEDD